MLDSRSHCSCLLHGMQ